MTKDNDNTDIPTLREIYVDAWRNDRRWRWEVILFTLALIAFLVFTLVKMGVL